MPDVTIFIPVFNGQAHVAQAVESVLAQTDPDFELLIVDDASFDATAKILNRYTSDCRVKIITHEKNRGVASCGNHVIDTAKGRYLLRLDADDMAHPERVRRQKEVLDQNSLLHVLGSQVSFFESKTGVTQLPRTDGGIKANFLTCANNICNPASAVRLDFVRVNKIRYDESLRSVEDLRFWVDCMYAGAKFFNLPEVLTAYRIHPHQASAVVLGVGATQKELRRRMLTTWFPFLRTQDCEAALPLLTSAGTVSLSVEQVTEGLQALESMVMNKIPPPNGRYGVHGEDRQVVTAYLQDVHIKWLERLNTKR